MATSQSIAIRKNFDWNLCKISVLNLFVVPPTFKIHFKYIHRQSTCLFSKLNSYFGPTKQYFYLIEFIKILYESGMLVACVRSCRNIYWNLRSICSFALIFQKCIWIPHLSIWFWIKFNVYFAVGLFVKNTLSSAQVATIIFSIQDISEVKIVY